MGPLPPRSMLFSALAALALLLPGLQADGAECVGVVARSGTSPPGGPRPGSRASAAGSPALLKSLLHPRAREFRLEAGEALRRLRDPSAVGVLLDALQGAAPRTRADSYEALRRLASTDDRELVRTSAERNLANPRLSLILR